MIATRWAAAGALTAAPLSSPLHPPALSSSLISQTRRPFSQPIAASVTDCQWATLKLEQLRSAAVSDEPIGWADEWPSG